MKIAIFDYRVTKTNAIGSCHLRILEALCQEHEFTVFAVEFENPCPQRIHWVRIPALRRPMALLFLTFHLLAPIYYWIYRLTHAVRFDLTQTIESQSLLGQLCYSHFCHRAYIKHHWEDSPVPGMHGAVRWLAHWLNALLEERVLQGAGRIVVPSRGLARELLAEYPQCENKVQILPNAVDAKKMQPPQGFNRESFRHELGLAPGDFAIVFVSLGHYERKGLPQLLDALKLVDRSNLKLTVVGGTTQLLSPYRKLVAEMDLGAQVRFVGMQKDVRPYLWSADVFALPSAYEVFPLVALEAAAAGLPLLTTRLNGVEEFLVDGANGFQVEKNGAALAQGIMKSMSLSPDDLKRMGEQARRSVQRFSTEAFVDRWRLIYSTNPSL
jgi:glycosyltransferase involved in cell wall biosynthesis